MLFFGYEHKMYYLCKKYKKPLQIFKSPENKNINAHRNTAL